jgi:hypothetical protein
MVFRILIGINAVLPALHGRHCVNTKLPVSGSQCSPLVGPGDVNVTRWLFFSCVISETIQQRSYAGFSEGDRYARLLDSVPFVERFA